MANEVLKAKIAKVRLEKMRAEVIDRAKKTAIEQDSPWRVVNRTTSRQDRKQCRAA
jgi:hypothetical protein